MDRSQSKIPLFEALLAHSKKSRHSFHVPGHKNGTLLPEAAKECYRSLLSLDVTELSGLDDLHHPSGVIKEAEDLAAKLYRSDRCFFLVGGSTVGNLAMIKATCKEGDTVLVQRNSHKSILNGLRLAKVHPIFIQPQFDIEAQIATCLEEENVIKTIKKFSNAKAIIITNPNYYGYTISLQKIVAEAHKYNIAVLVDEAHGAHFGHRSNFFPKSAVEYGADIVVQSAHKTLPAMTMGSYLHFNSKLVNIEKLAFYLQVLQSSSPSYPLMASLDLARYFLANVTEAQLTETVKSIKAFKNGLNNIPQLKVIENDSYEIDRLKVTVQSNCPLNGFQLQKLLEEEGIYTELADPYNILFVMPLITTSDVLIVAKKIKQKLKEFPVYHQMNKMETNLETRVTSLQLSYKKMDEIEKEMVPLEKSIGKVISEEIIPYPPGVPILLSGEKIEEGHLKILADLKKAGAHFQGTDVFESGVKVFKNK